MTVVLTAKASGVFYHLPAFVAADPPQPRRFPSPSPCLLHSVSASSPAKISAGSARLSSLAVSTNRGKPHKQVDGNPRRVFFLDVNPLCYRGAQPSLYSFADWLSLFFSQVSVRDPVVAVLDGEDGNEYRKQLLPSYKAHRRRFRHWPDSLRASGESEVVDVLQKCCVPVIKIEGYEADDVIATLTGQVLQRGHRVVIASPDKDFKQLISEHVQIVMPIPELERWSFYTLRHYIEQYKCDPSCDLSLRCLLGDEVDGVPGIRHVAPGFGRKTALKLLKRHGTLANLLNAATVRTVGKQYAQDALNRHADYLRRNFEVLSLRRDAEVQIKEEWLAERDNHNDSAILSTFVKVLDRRKRLENRQL